MRKQPTTRSPRDGFTLIEMLMVISLIAILVALIAPAIMNAAATARVAAVGTEIRSIESAVAAFRNIYGIDPPSFIQIAEREGNWTVRSRNLITRMWPQYDFSTPNNFNGDNDNDDVLALEGAECLVFFLGGVLSGTDSNNDGVPDDNFALTGFSKNPEFPFAPSAGSGARQGPFFDFKMDRVDVTTRPDSFVVATYRDSLPGQIRPYYYVTNDRYNLTIPIPPANLNFTEIPPPPFMVYMQNAKSSFKPKTYQLISAGIDGNFGVSFEHSRYYIKRIYNSDDAVRDGTLLEQQQAGNLPTAKDSINFINPTGNPINNGKFDFLGPFEFDNITNFSDGALRK